ncbi:MAG: hypothetical protein QNJ38_18930 [Prochloraceae cyanobacterium]|nr:hypothetical protein [Prochloraceae cyanobacterium]
MPIPKRIGIIVPTWALKSRKIDATCSRVGDKMRVKLTHRQMG